MLLNSRVKRQTRELGDISPASGRSIPCKTSHTARYSRVGEASSPQYGFLDAASGSLRKASRGSISAIGCGSLPGAGCIKCSLENAPGADIGLMASAAFSQVISTRFRAPFFRIDLSGHVRLSQVGHSLGTRGTPRMLVKPSFGDYFISSSFFRKSVQSLVTVGTSILCPVSYQFSCFGSLVASKNAFASDSLRPIGLTEKVTRWVLYDRRRGSHREAQARIPNSTVDP